MYDEARPLSKFARQLRADTRPDLILFGGCCHDNAIHIKGARGKTLYRWRATAEEGGYKSD
jgi:hypothetical protein